MTDQEIIYKAIREVVNTDKPSEFAAHNSTAYTIAKYVCEAVREQLGNKPTEELDVEINLEYKSNYKLRELSPEEFREIVHHFTQWQKDNTINKACQWIQQNAEKYTTAYDHLSQDFKKAMEE